MNHPTANPDNFKIPVQDACQTCRGSGCADCGDSGLEAEAITHGCRRLPALPNDDRVLADALTAETNLGYAIRLRVGEDFLKRCRRIRAYYLKRHDDDRVGAACVAELIRGALHPHPDVCPECGASADVPDGLCDRVEGCAYFRHENDRARTFALVDHGLVRRIGIPRRVDGGGYVVRVRLEHGSSFDVPVRNLRDEGGDQPGLVDLGLDPAVLFSKSGPPCEMCKRPIPRRDVDAYREVANDAGASPAVCADCADKWAADARSG